MAKRELSSTLRNLKFMQRTPQREEAKPKDNDEKPTPTEESFGGSPAPLKRCIVIMEGNPHPGAIKGRMSFQSFNPSIDKLHEEARNVDQMPQSNMNNRNGSSDREDGVSAVGSEESNSASPGKRKQPEMDIIGTPSPSHLQTVAGEDGQSSSQSNLRGSNKQQKREKLDWSVLRPPRPQIRRN